MPIFLTEAAILINHGALFALSFSISRRITLESKTVETQIEYDTTLYAFIGICARLSRQIFQTGFQRSGRKALLRRQGWAKKASMKLSRQSPIRNRLPSSLRISMPKTTSLSGNVSVLEKTTICPICKGYRNLQAFACRDLEQIPISSENFQPHRRRPNEAIQVAKQRE